MFSRHSTRQHQIAFFGYGALNLLAIILVNRASDLPILLGNWEKKATALSQLNFPGDNFYPPGSAILLVPFLWAKPNYEIAVYFYFTAASLIYFLICNRVLQHHKFRLIALAALPLNPYLLWTCNSGQDTVFELFLLLSFGALLIKDKVLLSLAPLYLLCLVRPAYWSLLFIFPILFVARSLKRKDQRVKMRFASIPFAALAMTMTLNVAAFGAPNLATESGLAVLFSHNKYYYLSMPKFDMDVFLSTGGNMDPARVLGNSHKFQSIKDLELRAGLVSIFDNPKSVFLNSIQKVDSYFFAVQKTPQLTGSYYLSEDQKSIVIENERLSWILILGNAFYFIYRSLLLVLGIAALTLYLTYFRRNKINLHKNVAFLLLPYLSGAISGILFYTESRFKVVSELLLVPLIIVVFHQYRVTTKRLSI